MTLIRRLLNDGSEHLDDELLFGAGPVPDQFELLQQLKCGYSYVATAQSEALIEANKMLNDLRRESVAFE